MNSGCKHETIIETYLMYQIQLNLIQINRLNITTGILSTSFTMVLFAEVGAQWNTNEPVERSRAHEERRRPARAQRRGGEMRGGRRQARCPAQPFHRPPAAPRPPPPTPSTTDDLTYRTTNPVTKFGESFSRNLRF